MLGLLWQKRNRLRRRESSRRSFLSSLGAGMDRVISAIAPTWGARRQASRARTELTAKVREAQLKRIERVLSANSWDAARNDHLRSGRWLASNLSPDTAAKQDLLTLQQRCAELYRNSSTTHSAIEGRVSHEVGVGILPQARIRAEDLDWTQDQAKQANSEIESLIQRWSDHGVDKGRVLSLQMLIRQVVRSFATYGEAFIEFGATPFRGPIPLALNVISPERVETPPQEESNEQTRLGVERDGNDQVVAYWVRTEHPGDEWDKATWERIPRFRSDGTVRIVHVFDAMVPEQSRGIPWLAAAINRIKDLDDFFEAELINKQIEACFGLIIKTSEDGASPQDLAEGSATETLSDGRRLEEIEPGMVEYLEEGQEATTIDPQRPGSTFAPFVEQALRSIAGALNYPYELLAKNFFRTTFSSGRLAILDGRMAFKMRRSIVIDQFLNPLYCAILYDAVFMDAIPSIDLLDYRMHPWLYEKHKWQGQAWGLIDPEKEVRASALAVNEGLTTKSDVSAEQGKDFEEQHEQRTRERMMEVEADIEVRSYRKELEKAAGLMPEESPEPEPQPVGADNDDD